MVFAEGEGQPDDDAEENEMISISSDWRGSIMGDIGTNDITYENFQITENDDDTVTMRVSNNRGKIASSDEGLAYYFKEVDPNANYTLTATAHVDSWTANNQVGFGIMLRGNVLENERDPDFTGDYVAVGALDQVMKGFYKYEDSSVQKNDWVFESTIDPAAGQEYEISLQKSGNIYILKIGDEEHRIEDYTGEINYAGLFAARNVTVTYSDVNLSIEGEVELGDWDFSAFGGNVNITNDPPRNPDPTLHEDGSVTLFASGGKIANADEGISYYFKEVPADANFEINTTATVRSFNSDSSISTPNQKSFGLMLRDEIGEHGDTSTQTSNFVALGALDIANDSIAGIKGFYKTGTENGQPGTGTLQRLSPFAELNFPAANEVYDLTIRKSGNTYVVTANGFSETIEADGLFTDNVFAGFYVARDAEVTFSDFSINVDARTVAELQVDSSNMKTEYLVGESLDLSGLVVTAVFSDGGTSVLSENDYIVTGFNSTQVGTNTITINFGGATATVDLEIVDLTITDLEIQYLPAKTEYFMGDRFDPEGLEVVGEYNDGYAYETLSRDQFHFSISGEDVDESYVFTSPGTKTVTIISTNSPEVTTSFDVMVADTEITELEIRTNPAKMQYFIGDELDLSGMVVYAVYGDGSEVRLTANEYEVSDLDTSTPGDKEVVISHKGKEVVLKLNVKERELQTLEVTSYPQTTFLIGEDFNSIGLEVSKVYDNGDKEVFVADNYTVKSDAFDNTQEGIYNIQIVPGTTDIEAISYQVTVREAKEYDFDFIMFGQSTSENRNDWSITDDGAIRLEAFAAHNAGKITGDHDGIVFYYTVLDANEDNFELSADIKVEHYAKTPHDGQESFGIMARDAIGTHGDSGVFSSNIAAVGGFAGGTRELNGTQLFVRTGVLAPDGEGSEGIQKKMLKQERPSIDNTYPNQTYRLTLAKTNSGFTGKLDDGSGIHEDIIFEPEILNVQDDKMYVGFYVAREATIEVSNIELTVSAAKTDAPRVEPPAEPITPNLEILSLEKTPLENYDLKMRANADGTVSVRQGTEFIARHQRIEQGEVFSLPTNLNANSNTNFSISFLPDDTQYLTSYDRIIRNFTVTNKIFQEDGDIYVTVNGTSAGTGSIDDPLDIDTAIDFVLPGQKIIVGGGTYLRDAPLRIRRYNDGTPDAMKYLVAAPGERPVFDFDRRHDGMLHEGNYWHVKGLDFTRAGGNRKGYHIGGHHNIIENSRFYENGDSGLQISRIDTTLDNFEDWPSNNLILNSVAFDNRDPAENNADGFAIKLTVGEGNVLRGTIAHNNVDDGFDLYAKVGTGAIGTVVIEDSLAFNNGTLTDGTVGGGDKNGFKLGGEGIHVPHVIRNSIAWGNGKVGFSSNSNPGVIAENNISFNNLEGNLDFTTYSNITPDFTIDGFISFHTEEGNGRDRYPAELKSDKNFLYDGSQTLNASGEGLPSDLIDAIGKITEFKRDTDGNIDWLGVWDVYFEFMEQYEKDTHPGNGIGHIMRELNRQGNKDKDEKRRLMDELLPRNPHPLP